MLPAIKILPGELSQLPGANYHLLVLTGDCHWQFALLNRDKKKIEAVLGYHFSTTLAEDEFEKNWNDLLAEYPFLNQFYADVTLVFQLQETTLLPGKDFSEEEATLVFQTLLGEKENTVIKSDYVAEQDIRVLYRIPEKWYQLLHRTYINAVDKHYYSGELTAISKEAPSSLLRINFLGSCFNVCLIQNSQLQIMQLYEYHQSEDVLFYLLTITKEFEGNQEELLVEVGGMIDEQSALYDELKKYFLNIRLVTQPEGLDFSPALEEYPLHYFHSLFTVVSCV